MYRKLIKALRARDELPQEFASLDCLPIVAVKWLHRHLSTQEAVRKIVISAVQYGTMTTPQSAQHMDLNERLEQHDKYLASRVRRNVGSALLHPFEQLFGIL